MHFVFPDQGSPSGVFHSEPQVRELKKK